MITAFKEYFSTAETKLKLTDEFQRLYGKLLAPKFNCIDFWGMNENKVSEILAYFLNPNEKHAQGDSFLKILCEEADLDYPFNDYRSLEVKCERTTTNGRKIDMVVSKNRDEFVLGIENKIYQGTADQKNQIIDYLKYLEKISKGNFCLIYLAPKSKELAEISISEYERAPYVRAKKLVLISYEDNLIKCLDNFRKTCEAENVKAFLKDFSTKLKNMYMGEADITEQKMLIDHARKSHENLEIALKISQAVAEVKVILKEEIEKQLSEIGNKFNVRVDKMKITPSNWTRHHIAFSFESSGLIYGIKRNKEDDKKTTLPEIIKFFRGDWNTSKWWPMWQFLYKNIEGNNRFYLDIQNGEFKKKAAEFIEAIVVNFNSTEY